MASKIDWTYDEGGDGSGGVDRRSLFTEEEWALEEVFTAQLRWTADLIHFSVTSHRHFTDDCGDYLFAALDLSLQLQGVRMEGDLEQLRLFLRELAETKIEKAFVEGEKGWLQMKVDLEHACDGVAPELYGWCKANAWSNDPAATERIQRGDWD